MNERRKKKQKSSKSNESENSHEQNGISKHKREMKVNCICCECAYTVDLVGCLIIVMNAELSNINIFFVRYCIDIIGMAWRARRKKSFSN